MNLKLHSKLSGVQTELLRECEILKSTQYICSQSKEEISISCVSEQGGVIELKCKHGDTEVILFTTIYKLISFISNYLHEFLAEMIIEQQEGIGVVAAKIDDILKIAQNAQKKQAKEV